MSDRSEKPVAGADLFELIDEQDIVLTTMTSPLMLRRREAGVRP